MDIGIVLGIIGILLTMLSFLITTYKINNSKVNNSFNKTTINNKHDSRTFINHNNYEMSEHHHHTKLVVKQGAEDTSDNMNMIGVLIGTALAAGMGLYLFVQYQSQLVVILFTLAIFGLVYTSLVVFLKRDYLIVWQRVAIILQWILVFAVIIFSQKPFITPSNLDEVMDSLRNLEIGEALGAFFGLLTKGYEIEAYYLLFKLMGLVFCLAVIFLNYYVLIRMSFKKNLEKSKIQHQIIGNAILLGIALIMVSGLLIKLFNVINTV